MPPGLNLGEVRWTRGEIRISALGVLVARLDDPVVISRRREVATPELGRYDLHAAVSYFNQHLWDDADFKKDVVVYIGRKPVKVFTYEGTSVVHVPGSLRMEGVEYEWSVESAQAS